MTAPTGRHPELVSGSMPERDAASDSEAWMLKQVQHDDECRQFFQAQNRVAGGTLRHSKPRSMRSK
jgi:hypothetical protein